MDELHLLHYSGAEPVTLEVEVSDTTRTSLPVNDSACRLLVLEAVGELLSGRIDTLDRPVIE